MNIGPNGPVHAIRTRMAAPELKLSPTGRLGNAGQHFCIRALPVRGPELPFDSHSKRVHGLEQLRRRSNATETANATTDVVVSESVHREPHGLSPADQTADCITIIKEDLIYSRRDVILKTLADSIGETSNVEANSISVKFICIDEFISE